MRVTADDVAAAAGVSRSAVSRAFTVGASIAADKRDHILAIATSLGYRPNLIARGLTGQQTGLIAVVVGDVSSPYEAWLLGALSAGVRRNGNWPLLIPVAPNVELDSQLEHALSYQVDGAVVAAGSVGHKLAERCAALGTPIVMVGRVPDGGGADSVCCDNRMGMQLVVDLLLGEGRSRIAWVGGKSDTFSNVERFDGLRSALAQQGHALVAERRGDYSVESGLTQALDLLTARNRPDAIVCGNDAMAIGAVSAARRLGLSVPGDVAITGFDDIPAAAWEPFSLTTIQNPVEETVDAALRMLQLRISGNNCPPENVRLLPKLLRRESA